MYQMAHVSGVMGYKNARHRKVILSNLIVFPSDADFQCYWTVECATLKHKLLGSLAEVLLRGWTMPYRRCGALNNFPVVCVSKCSDTQGKGFLKVHVNVLLVQKCLGSGNTTVLAVSLESFRRRKSPKFFDPPSHHETFDKGTIPLKDRGKR